MKLTPGILSAARAVSRRRGFTLVEIALSIAIIGLVQGAGVSQGTPNPDGRYPDVSRDFLGQGAANMATSLVGGIPAGGSVSGTALIMGAGARSRWGNIFVGLFVALKIAIALLAALVVLPPLIVWADKRGWVSKGMLDHEEPPYLEVADHRSDVAEG